MEARDIQGLIRESSIVSNIALSLAEVFGKLRPQRYCEVHLVYMYCPTVSYIAELVPIVGLWLWQSIQSGRTQWKEFRSLNTSPRRDWSISHDNQLLRKSLNKNTWLSVFLSEMWYISSFHTCLLLPLWCHLLPGLQKGLNIEGHLIWDGQLLRLWVESSSLDYSICFLVGVSCGDKVLREPVVTSQKHLYSRGWLSFNSCQCYKNIVKLNESTGILPAIHVKSTVSSIPSHRPS